MRVNGGDDVKRNFSVADPLYRFPRAKRMRSAGSAAHPPPGVDFEKFNLEIRQLAEGFCNLEQRRM